MIIFIRNNAQNIFKVKDIANYFPFIPKLFVPVGFYHRISGR